VLEKHMGLVRIRVIPNLINRLRIYVYHLHAVIPSPVDANFATHFRTFLELVAVLPSKAR
jgi:hypothetical protein